MISQYPASAMKMGGGVKVRGSLCRVLVRFLTSIIPLRRRSSQYQGAWFERMRARVSNGLIVGAILSYYVTIR